MIKLPKAVNSLKSQSFGRRVYCMESDDRKYWLKLQVAHINSEYERSFLNELEIYRQLSDFESADDKILCNFSISNINGHFQSNYGQSGHYLNNELFLEQVLSVEHADALFAKSPFGITFIDVVEILQKSLDVLDHLHQLEFIHGDLKVEHFRYLNHRAALIDLEQCCHITSVSKMPNTATPRYMAPELFHAESKSFATDVYALGVIWLEWLTQERFQQKNYLDWAKLHCQSLKIELSVGFKPLDDVLILMLSKNKVHRCSNIYQLKQLLSQIV